MGATNSTTRPQVLKTSQNGSLTGITEANPTTGKPVLTRYTRIPYAQPPTGQRRWRRPQALPKDHTFSLENGEPGDYTEFGHVCPQPVYQHDSVVLPNPRAAAPIVRVPDEDCLFLNIWVPCGDVPEGGWPVQIFIRTFVSSHL
jgi:carboxylesterase type B